LLTHASVKDINILLGRSDIHDIFESWSSDAFQSLLLAILKNHINILEHFLYITRLLRLIFIACPKEVFLVFWNTTIYSKLFEKKNILQVIGATSSGIPVFTKKLELLYRHHLINPELLYESSISNKMTKNISSKLNCNIFCKYNNFVEYQTTDVSQNKIEHLLLKSMHRSKEREHVEHTFTVALKTASSILYDLYPPIPQMSNNRLEYSLQTIGPDRIPIYIVSDYYAHSATVRDRMNKLTSFHPWANKEFKSLLEEMEALQAFVIENKQNNQKNLWWPQQFFCTNFPPTPFPETIYENNGWLFLDSQGLVINFNPKYRYIFRNTNWVNELEWVIGFDRLIVIEGVLPLPDGSMDASPIPTYKDGLWKCEWLPNLGPMTFRPVELMDNKATVTEEIPFLDINSLRMHYNNIVIPNDVKARYKVNPCENVFINDNSSGAPSWMNMGCGADYIKDVENVDINPFYTCFNKALNGQGILFKYCDWIIDTSDHFIEFLKLVNKYTHVCLVFINGDLLSAKAGSGKYYFEDGSYIEKINDTPGQWPRSCDLYKAKGLINWLGNTEQEFFIPNISLFENSMSNFELFCEYRNSPITGLLFKKKEEVKKSEN
jgi:hypothetical protein